MRRAGGRDGLDGIEAQDGMGWDGMDCGCGIADCG